jgi:protein-disulfide isomerase
MSEPLRPEPTAASGEAGHPAPGLGPAEPPSTSIEGGSPADAADPPVETDPWAPAPTSRPPDGAQLENPAPEPWMAPEPRSEPGPEPGSAPDPWMPPAPGPEPGPELETEPEPAHEPQPVVARRRSRAPLVGAVAVAIALVLGGAGTFGLLAATGHLAAGATPSPEPTPEPTPTPTVAPAMVIESGSVGLSNAPVTIEIWADYQCPYCKLEIGAYSSTILREFVQPGRAKLVYRDFAFLGRESIDAAVAAHCAGRQGGEEFWRYHDVLFVAQQGENQGTFARENLVALSRIAGLDATAFTACLDDPAVKAEVTDSTAEGGTLGITSTPTTRIIGPGGTQTLKGFSKSWPTIEKAFVAAETPGGSSSPVPGDSAGPGSVASAAPGSTSPATPGSTSPATPGSTSPATPGSTGSAAPAPTPTPGGSHSPKP